MYRRTTADGIRVTISQGNVYLGNDQYTRKPLTDPQAALLAGIVGMADADEVCTAIKAARTCDTIPAAIAFIEKVAAKQAAKKS